MDSSEDKRRVKFMEGKGGAAGGGRGEETVQSQAGADIEAKEDIKKKPNFFDFQEDVDTDVWGPKFTSTLRKAR